MALKLFLVYVVARGAECGVRFVLSAVEGWLVYTERSECAAALLRPSARGGRLPRRAPSGLAKRAPPIQLVTGQMKITCSVNAFIGT
jgi:hypothetical protein